MSYSRARSIIKFNYNINDTILCRPNEFTDLGVIFNNKVLFDKQIVNMVNGYVLMHLSLKYLNHLVMN